MNTLPQQRSFEKLDLPDRGSLVGAAQTLSREEDFRTGLRAYEECFDLVTGLPNHVFFRVAIHMMLRQARSHGEEIVLLWVDLTNLRREYSVGGDAAAERLLCMVADSLRPHAEEGEIVCRFSDHCFLLALRRDDRIDARLELIIEDASHRHVRGTEGKPEVAMGYSVFPDDSAKPGELIRFASLAAISAARTRSRIAIPFLPHMNSALLQERLMERDLRSALKENQLSLVYQPQIDLQTGEVIGVETLTRWNHPTRGEVAREQFISVAEQSDLIDEVFSHSLRRLLQDASTWRAAGVVLPSVALNASPANIRHQNFVAIIEAELKRCPLFSSQLDIEVTESLLMEDEDLFRERLSDLRAIGIKVSLDDFGTKYTGFNTLKGLPLNTMKIDKCFVRWVNRSRQAESLCKALVSMATDLNLDTVAEGVEDIEELRILRKIGCRAGQGYLFQRPRPSDGFLAFMQDWPERLRQQPMATAFSELNMNQTVQAESLFGLV